MPEMPDFDEIMKMARVGPGDYVIDLGSGDGRLVIAAVAKYQARGGFGTVCSSLLAVPDGGPPVWLFAAGPPDEAPFVPVG